MKGVILLVFVLVCLHSVLGLHQIISESEKKCYIEEVPRDTLVLVQWKAEDLTRSLADQLSNPIGFKVTVKDPDNTIIYSKPHPFSSRAAFTVFQGGEHEICIQSNASRWFGNGLKVKLEVDIETGSGAVDYEELAQAEHLSELQTEVRRLNDQAREVIKEQSYLKGREMISRDESEGINSKVMWWSIAETGLLVISGMWQIRHLKQFFRQKKLV
eukprot:TRINITY_DN2497_c0_g1_i1.p1 TRINITY_DN2497_c0_g1~~TRINITY_DN2497_c0_g1_i1.p1  ORF type:complete len:215 (-),score=56.21 TRINITY_DN2497_c0_g1_i1:58-702(-)